MADRRHRSCASSDHRYLDRAGQERRGGWGLRGQLLNASGDFEVGRAGVGALTAGDPERKAGGLLYLLEEGRW